MRGKSAVGALTFAGFLLALGPASAGEPAAPAAGEADELAGWAEAALKSARGPSDYDAAAQAYQKALLLAPGAAEYYRGLAQAQEGGGHYADAIASLRSYLLAAPSASDARDIHRRIGALAFQASGRTQTPEPGDLLDRLKKLAAKRYDLTYECGHETPLEALRKLNPMECDQREYSEARWHRVERSATHQLRFPKEGTIQLWSVSMFSASRELEGRPRGPRIEDVAWARCDGGGGCVKPVWVHWESDLSAVAVSFDRPVDEKAFDPKARYAYARYAAGRRETRAASAAP